MSGDASLLADLLLPPLPATMAALGSWSMVRLQPEGGAQLLAQPLDTARQAQLVSQEHRRNKFPGAQTPLTHLGGGWVQTDVLSPAAGWPGEYTTLLHSAELNCRRKG